MAALELVRDKQVTICNDEVLDALCEITGKNYANRRDIYGKAFVFYADGEKPEEVGWSIEGTFTHLEFSPAQNLLLLWSGPHLVEFRRASPNGAWDKARFKTPIHHGRVGRLEILD